MFLFYLSNAWGAISLSHSMTPSCNKCTPGSPAWNLVRGHTSTIWDIVWRSPQLHKSVLDLPHFLRVARQGPCWVRNLFNMTHWARGRSNPGCRIAGSSTRLKFTTLAESQADRHSTRKSKSEKESMSSHSGLLELSPCGGWWQRSLYRPQSWWFKALLSKLQVATFRRIPGGAMLARTGNQSTAVALVHPEMILMDWFNCTSTLLT